MIDNQKSLYFNFSVIYFLIYKNNKNRNINNIILLL